jgi:hypothetical protein
VEEFPQSPLCFQGFDVTVFLSLIDIVFGTSLSFDDMIVILLVFTVKDSVLSFFYTA